MTSMWRIGRALLVAALSVGEACAQGYPARTGRLVVPASPGGASDLAARILARALASELGQPFIVENRVTSGGIMATQQVAESPPDGHMLLVTFDTFAVNRFVFKDLKWDPLRDFAPVMQICRFPQVLVVHPSLGVKSVKEFVALAKDKGASLNYGSARPAPPSPPAYQPFNDMAGHPSAARPPRGARAAEPDPGS